MATLAHNGQSDSGGDIVDHDGMLRNWHLQKQPVPKKNHLAGINIHLDLFTTHIGKFGDGRRVSFL